MSVALGVRGLHFKVAAFIVLLVFEWHSQNEVGNIVILVLRRNCEKHGMSLELFAGFV